MRPALGHGQLANDPPFNLLSGYTSHDSHFGVINESHNLPIGLVMGGAGNDLPFGLVANLICQDPFYASYACHNNILVYLSLYKMRHTVPVLLPDWPC